MPYHFAFPDIAQALYAALSHEPFYQALERHVNGDPSAGPEAMVKYFDYSMQEGRDYGVLYGPESVRYGAAVWLKPVRPVLAAQMAAAKESFLRQYLGDVSWNTYRTIVEFMTIQALAHIPAESWYLSIVGLAPQFQGQGLGRGLIQPVLDQADALGLPTYLETFTPRNMSFYQRLGYQTTASRVEPVTGAEYWLMLRVPLANPRRPCAFRDQRSQSE